MFTGIVQGTGMVESAEVARWGRRLVVRPEGTPGALDAFCSAGPALSSGDSISVDGCCLTLVEPVGGPRPRLVFDIVHQSLSLTTLGSLREGDRVHLEKAVTPTTALGGHLMQGHVDGIADIVEVDSSGGSWRLRLRPPEDLMDFIVLRGSVALAGVSLTVAETDRETFAVALIPATLERTTFAERKCGDRVNIEVDQIARIVVNWMARTRHNAE